MNEMRDYTPITIAQLAAQPTATLAYKLVDDPSAGNKVMHLRCSARQEKHLFTAWRHTPSPS